MEQAEINEKMYDSHGNFVAHAVRVVATEKCMHCKKMLVPNQLIIAVGNPLHAFYHIHCVPNVDLSCYPHSSTIPEYRLISQMLYERQKSGTI
jgi:hypothetical protein